MNALTLGKTSASIRYLRRKLALSHSVIFFCDSDHTTNTQLSHELFQYRKLLQYIYMTVGNIRCTSYRTSFVVYFSRYNFYTRFFTRREASVRYQVISRSDRPATPCSHNSFSSSRTEFAGAANRALVHTFSTFSRRQNTPYLHYFTM